MATRVAATIEPMGDGNFPVVAANHVSGLATVATTGSYNDLLDLPSPSGSSTNSEYAEKIGKDSAHPTIGSYKLPTYVNESGVVTPITELEVAGTALTPEDSTIVDHIIALYDNYSWSSSYYNCWNIYLLFGLTNWSINQAYVTIKSTQYYVKLTDFSEGNLTDYCPNANSYSPSGSTFAPVYNSNDIIVSGICFQKSRNNSIYLWLDAVLFPGTYSEHTDFLDENDVFISKTITVNRPASVNTTQVNTSTIATETINDLENVNAKYFNCTQSTQATYKELVSLYYKETMAYDNTLQCYKSWINLTNKNISYGTNCYINKGSSFLSGIWYEAGEGEGYSNITTYYNNTRYCLFSDSCCIIEIDTDNLLLCCNSAFYDSCTEANTFFAQKRVSDADAPEGIISLKGKINILNENYEDNSYEYTQGGSLNCDSVEKYDSTKITETNNLNFNNRTSNVNNISLESYITGGPTNYIFNYNVYLQPFSELEIYWSDDLEHSDGIMKNINSSDWWIDSDNNNIGFHIFSASNNDNIELWYTTKDHRFHLTVPTVQGIIQVFSFWLSVIHLEKGINYNFSLIAETAKDTKKTYNTPAQTVMVDGHSALQISPQQIRIGNPSDSNGEAVYIGRNYITIGNTTINEVQLQALLAMITNPPAPATLGIMSIVE